MVQIYCLETFKKKTLKKKAKKAAKEIRKRLAEKKAACCNLFACIGSDKAAPMAERKSENGAAAESELVITKDPEAGKGGSV
jgi:hypothetical protein